MATYNGERFLAEQIESVLNQKNVEIDLLIADDVSTDGTIEIISSFSRRHKNIKFIQNKTNLGYRLNFYNLIKNASEEYDYYALSDQDDVWKEDKIFQGVQALNKMPNNAPNIYFSNLDVVDSHLSKIKMMESTRAIKKYSKLNLLLENKCTGCTLVFNLSMKKWCSSLRAEDFVLLPHDAVICRLALLYGNFFYDCHSYILYRQHENNQIGAATKRRLKKYISILFGKKEIHQSIQLKKMVESFGEECSIPEAKIVSSYKHILAYRLKILFSHKIIKKGFKNNIIFKMAILFGRY